MSDVMSIEQAEFIDTLQSWFNQSTNMCHEDCYYLAFIIWQHKDYLSKMLGYEQGRAEAIDDLVKKVCEFGAALEYAECYAISPTTMKQTIADFGEQLKEQNK